MGKRESAAPTADGCSFFTCTFLNYMYIFKIFSVEKLFKKNHINSFVKFVLTNP